MNVQRALTFPMLTSLEPPRNMVMSASGYKAFAKLCAELWPGEDGLCDPMGFLPTDNGDK
jgi:hypothetical protein